jgi:hypothetical protein
VASEAEANLNTLRTDLAQSQEVVSAIKKIGGDLSSAASAVVNTPAFQDAVVTKTAQNVTQNIANLLSGLSGTNCLCTRKWSVPGWILRP